MINFQKIMQFAPAFAYAFDLLDFLLYDTNVNVSNAKHQASALQYI